jgi:hypothetical protein
VSKATGATSGPELLILPELLRSFPDLSVVSVAEYVVFCVFVVDNCYLFVLFHLVIALSLPRIMVSDYSFGILKIV